MPEQAPLLSQGVSRVIVPIMLNPERPFFPRELERITGETINGVTQALARLVRDGLVEVAEVGGRKGYRAVRAHLYYPEMLRIAIKTIGIPERLDLGGIRSLKVAVIGSFAKGDFAQGSDLDVLVVGDEPSPGAADAAMASTSTAAGRSISVIVVDPAQYNAEREQASGFVGSVLAGPVIVLRGVL